MTVFVLVRFGMLAFTLAWVINNWMNLVPSPPSISAWYAEGWVFSIVLVLCLTVYGFFLSVGGRRVFRDPLLELEPQAPRGS